MISLKEFLDELAGKDHPFARGLYAGLGGENMPQGISSEGKKEETPEEKQIPVRYLRTNRN